MIFKTSWRGWVIVVFSLIFCWLLVDKMLFRGAPGKRDNVLNPGEVVTSTAVADPIHNDSRRHPGLKRDRAVSQSLPPPVDVRNDPRFSSAIDTFDHVQLTTDRIPLEYINARSYLNGLKKKLFIDDYRFIAMSLGLDCGGAEAAFDQLISSPGIHPVNPVPEAGSSMKNVQNSVLADRCKALIESRNPGYSNIAGVFLSRGIEDASQSQLLLDAMTFVAAKTETENVLKEDIRHSAGIRKRLDAEFGAGGGDWYAEAASETVSEYTQVLDAYKSVYQRRMTRHLGAAGDSIMEALGGLELNNVNFLEVAVPCN
ncbi:MAG: hypothetical protein LW626_10110 [Verrucomicrobium sp.]|jgi:hypothetical protein|nr:hypothetical protein [Verrucomicrobium sp.]